MLVIASTKPNKKIFLLGIAGGSGSGKTYFARELQNKLGSDVCEIVYQDNFYIDQSKKFDFDGGSVNFDHPNSIDFDLLAQCLLHLKQGKNTEIPIYDFVTHARKKETISMAVKKIILVDGILIFHAPQTRELFDEKIFFDTPEELRFQRRLRRDVYERGRTAEGVHSQFFKQVKPMHDEFVEPSKVFADFLVKDTGSYDEIFQEYFKKLQSLA